MPLNVEGGADIPPVRVAHAGVRLAISAALFPYVLIVPLALVGLVASGGWCGLAAFATAMALTVASVYSAVILLVTAVVLGVRIVRDRRRTGASDARARRLLAICLAGSVAPFVLAVVVGAISAGSCGDGRRIPVASSSPKAIVTAS